MEFEVARFWILYALGVILGIVSVIYFGQQLILDLSPTIKSFLLFLLFLFFLIGGIYTKTSILDNVSFILSGVSYIIFVVYTISRFSIGTNTTFLLLAFSSILFIGLGYLLNEKQIEISSKQARVLLATIIVLSGVFIIFDVSSPRPTYNLELNQNVNVSSDTSQRSIVVGNLTVQNNFVLSRVVDTPNYDGCIYFPEIRRIPTSLEDSRQDNIIGGSETRNYRLTIYFPFPRIMDNKDENNTDKPVVKGIYEIERHVGIDCPPQTRQKKIVIVETPNP